MLRLHPFKRRDAAEEFNQNNDGVPVSLQDFWKRVPILLQHWAKVSHAAFMVSKTVMAQALQSQEITGGTEI